MVDLLKAMGKQNKLRHQTGLTAYNFDLTICFYLI
jgi:hypothetical protein